MGPPVSSCSVLVRRPRLILFDEANSALHSHADEQVKQLLMASRDDAAVIMVTHRPSLLREADRVYELNDGHLEEAPTGAPRVGGIAS